ncbi:MAG: hypothetical protein LH702_18345 [Phormidesmis sp. CAN_BIN44]|nr:hypothetical protein [Phormidesmis sp. CAN_BIN44]
MTKNLREIALNSSVGSRQPIAERLKFDELPELLRLARGGWQFLIGLSSPSLANIRWTLSKQVY